MIDWNLPPDDVAWPVARGMLAYYESGGYYPVGGSAGIAETMAEVIESNGGFVLGGARVGEVAIDAETRTVTGVKMKRRRGGDDDDGDFIPCGVVVSAVGYRGTFERLIPEKAAAALGVDEIKTAVARAGLKNSHGHVCAYVSLDGTPTELGLRPANVHSFPDDLGDAYGYDVGRACRDFYANPLGGDAASSEAGGKKVKKPVEPLVTITSPSAKDPTWERDHPGRANALLLMEGIEDWFEPFKDTSWGRRGPEYEAFKARFESTFLSRLYAFYPKCEGRVTHVELSTPLTAAHFINAPGGGSYGLEWTKTHFDPWLQENAFNPSVKGVRGLYMTGEAIAFGGFYGALANGFITVSHVIGLPRFFWLLATDSRKTPPEVYEDGREPPGATTEEVEEENEKAKAKEEETEEEEEADAKASAVQKVL